MGIKNAEFDAELASVEKLLNTTHAKKVINKKWQAKWSFDIYYSVQTFSAYNFFGWFFCTFSSGFEPGLNFAFYHNHIELLKK